MNSPRYTLVPGQNLNTGGLGFLARAAIINNPTGQWWSLQGVPIPPYVTGVVAPFQSLTQSPRMESLTPAGFTSAPLAGEIGDIQFTDDKLPASSGVPFSPVEADDALHIGAYGNTLTIAGNTITPIIPTNAVAGDILLAFFVTYRNAVPPPTLNTAPVGWTLLDSGSSQNGGATRSGFMTCYETLFIPGMANPTLVTNNSTNMQGTIVALRNATARVGGTGNVSLTAPAAVMNLPGTDGANPGFAGFYWWWTSNNKLAYASIAPAGAVSELLKATGINSSQEFNLVRIPLTGGGSSPTLVITYAQNWTEMAHGRSFVYS